MFSDKNAQMALTQRYSQNESNKTQWSMLKQRPVFHFSWGERSEYTFWQCI